jgi:hypothetical protein
MPPPLMMLLFPQIHRERERERERERVSMMLFPQREKEL